MQVLEAMRQDVREAHHDRRGELALLEALHHVEQVDLARGIHVGTNHQVARWVHAEVTLAPGIDLVELRGIIDGPGDGTIGAPRRILPIALSVDESLVGIGCHVGAHDIK